MLPVRLLAVKLMKVSVYNYIVFFFKLRLEILFNIQQLISYKYNNLLSGEATIVSHLVDEYIKSGVRADQIGVITPYSMQVSLIKTLIHDSYDEVDVQTVDGFQGREKEVVILSLVRSNDRGKKYRYC